MLLWSPRRRCSRSPTLAWNPSSLGEPAWIDDRGAVAWGRWALLGLEGPALLDRGGGATGILAATACSATSDAIRRALTVLRLRPRANLPGTAAKRPPGARHESKIAADLQEFGGWWRGSVPRKVVDVDDAAGRVIVGVADRQDHAPSHRNRAVPMP